MLYAPIETTLTVRAEKDGSRVIAGRFPYNATAVLSDGGRRGRPQKERFAPKAFNYRVADEKAEIHLLVGHDFNKPLASKLRGTLSLTDTVAALLFEARIVPQVLATSYANDALALIEAGLAVGLSPGFRIPPERAVEDAEEIIEEPVNPEAGENGAIIRIIKAALLYELSVVTRPAYEESEVEARNWRPTAAKKVKRRWLW